MKYYMGCNRKVDAISMHIYVEKFELLKSRATARYIVHSMQQCDLYNIYKILYFSDVYAYKTYGRSVTSNTYVRTSSAVVPLYQFEQIDINTVMTTTDWDELSKLAIDTLNQLINKESSLMFCNDGAWLNTPVGAIISCIDIARYNGCDYDIIDGIIDSIISSRLLE